MDVQQLEQLNSFAEEIGSIVQHWGFKKIHGKIWTHLYLSPIPLNAAALISRLKISKALVSITLRDLLTYKVIEEIGRGADSTRTYKANPNVTGVIFDVLKTRELVMMTKVEALCKKLKECNANGFCANERLLALEEHICDARETLNTIITHGKLRFPSLG